MMKHKIVTLCVLCLVGGLLVLAGTGLSQAGSPPKATGGVGFTRVEDGESVKCRIEFNAHEGDPAKGKLNYRDANGDWFRADIRCVKVFSDKGVAFFSGPIVSANRTEWTDKWIKIAVYDGGTPGSKGDLVWGDMYDSDPGCDSYPDGPPFPVESGNLVVH